MGKLKAGTGFKINYIKAFHCKASSMRAFAIKISIMRIYHVEKTRLFFQKNLNFLGIGGENEPVYIDIFIDFQAAFF
jgi:hypothetical protein